MNNFWSYRAPAIAWALILFTLSSIPKLQSPFHFSKWDDKLNHLAAYAILGALVLRALPRASGTLPNAREVRLAAVLGILYGLFDELHQYFVPGRFVEFNDFVADAIGVMIGAGFYLWLCQR